MTGASLRELQLPIRVLAQNSCVMCGNLDFEYLAGCTLQLPALHIPSSELLTLFAMATWRLEASEHDKSAATSFRRNDWSRVESINLRCLNYSIRERETRRCLSPPSLSNRVDVDVDWSCVFDWFTISAGAPTTVWHRGSFWLHDLVSQLPDASKYPILEGVMMLPGDWDLRNNLGRS